LPEITKMAEDSKDQRAAAERMDEENAMEKSKEKRTNQFPRELTSSLDGKCSNCCACNDGRTIRQRLSKMQAHISTVSLAILMNYQEGTNRNRQIVDELKIIKEMLSGITSLLATTAPPTTTTTPTTTTPMTTMAPTNPPTTPKVPEIIKIANGKAGSNAGGTNGGDGSGDFPIEAFTGTSYCTGWKDLDGTDGSYNRPFPHLLWYEFPSFHTPVKFVFKHKYIVYPKTWMFVGSTDENCDQSSNWVDLCGDVVGLNTVDFADVSCDVPEYVGKARKPYKCLGIRILSNNRNTNTGACVSGIKIWGV